MNFREVVQRINSLDVEQSLVVANILLRQSNLRYRTQGNTTSINPNLLDEHIKREITQYIMSLK